MPACMTSHAQKNKKWTDETQEFIIGKKEYYARFEKAVKEGERLAKSLMKAMNIREREHNIPSIHYLNILDENEENGEDGGTMKITYHPTPGMPLYGGNRLRNIQLELRDLKMAFAMHIKQEKEAAEAHETPGGLPMTSMKTMTSMSSSLLFGEDKTPGNFDLGSIDLSEGDVVLPTLGEGDVLPTGGGTLGGDVVVPTAGGSTPGNFGLRKRKSAGDAPRPEPLKVAGKVEGRSRVIKVAWNGELKRFTAYSKRCYADLLYFLESSWKGLGSRSNYRLHYSVAMGRTEIRSEQGMERAWKWCEEQGVNTLRISLSNASNYSRYTETKL